ncbi:M10 family metallopeptidase [Adonisia turfae]|uniref:Peptidase metallopeptidase domain-containing protein n=1 Tax=Adonisia turfae CCMR0081 TaxID=2292702 RepID=A0A6M0RLQ4_9CYAN|nr:M10 family metallopeptidase [Adonisia turfae]NEZ56742.1 hypothetical protein [Adonisia turfae CCMR0081]
MTYGQITQSSDNTSTGDNNIDALLLEHRWADTTVTFSFTNNFKNDYEEETDYPAEFENGFQTLNATQRSVAREWMDMYESVSGLTLTELTGAQDRNATIRIAESSAANPARVGDFPGSTEHSDSSFAAGDIWFDNNQFNNPQMGDYAYLTFGHEIGHALGLKHGHSTEEGVQAVAMDANRDSIEFSVMTYRSYVGSPVRSYTIAQDSYPQSMMMYDIRAIQEMYGANFNHNSNDTVYRFSTDTGELSINGVGQGQPVGNKVFRTIWDGNGNDTYDFSNYTTNLSVDLRPGKWSNLDRDGNFQQAELGPNQHAQGHVYNALQYDGDNRSLIENANGGSGDDIIHGNNADNVLRGKAGNDVLRGYLGADEIQAGTGDDTVYGGFGNDKLYGFSGNDKLNGQADDDLIHGGAGHDIITGGFGNDRLNGDKGNDQLVGGAGNDILTGGAGADKFQFKSLQHGIDSITDFVRAQGDRITLVASGLGGGLTQGLLGAEQFVLGSATDANDRVLYNSSTGALSFDIDGSGSTKAVQIATLSAGTSLTRSDFVVV